VFAGAVIGTLVLGTAGDVYGRKPLFIATASLIAVAGTATAVCRTYEEILLARFWVGFGIGGLTVPFDTLGEFLPGAARGKNLLYIEFFWTLGTLSVPVLAYLTLDTSADAVEAENSHWQFLVLFCSIPIFLSVALGMVWVPESPRWLVEQSHHHGGGSSSSGSDCGRMRALEILKFAARSNGISQTKIDRELFPPNTKLVLSMDEVKHHLFKARATKTESKTRTKEEDSITDDESSMSTSNSNSNNDSDPVGFRELFRTPDRTRLTIILWATWFGFQFLYYGVIIAVNLVFTKHDNADDADDDQITQAYGFDYTAILITASAEVFGLITVLGTIDSIGRIPSQTIAYRIGGLTTFLLGVLYTLFNDDDDSNASFHRSALIGLAFVSRMAMMASSCTTWVSTSEVLSTEIRSTGHGAANAVGRLGGFVAPYVITEGNSMASIGVVVLLVALATAELAGRLPETAGKAMGGGDVSAVGSGGGSVVVSRDVPASQEPYRELL